MEVPRNKVLVLTNPATVNAAAIDSLRLQCDIVETGSIEKALELIKTDQFTGVFSEAADFLPLERALISQQAHLILNTIGEGVCIVDGEGRCNWMNKKMQAWPARVHEKIRRTCQEAFDIFSKQVSPQPADAPAFSRSKRYALNIEDQQYMELIASPVINPRGQVVQVVAVVWDATGTRRLQQKIDAIDNAGRELVRLEGEALCRHERRPAPRASSKTKSSASPAISCTSITSPSASSIAKPTSSRLVISAGLPQEALCIDLFAEPEGHGISGYVASTGRSYICPDVERDPRYVTGLESAKSSLTVPLRLHDKVIGIFNIESRHRAAFNEDDRQFAEIFGRYVAVALNILDLMVVERVSTSHKIADNVCSEAAGPLNDIASDASALMDDYIGHDDLRTRLQQILDNVGIIRKSLRQAAEGPNTVLGAADVKGEADPVIGGMSILVADDEPNIRNTICDVLRKYHAMVTTAANGAEAIADLNQAHYDLVISDIKMPDKSGYDVFAAAHKRNAAMPVILMTGFGYDPNHSIVRASQEGLQAVLFKPFKVDQLLIEVRRALQTPAAH